MVPAAVGRAVVGASFRPEVEAAHTHCKARGLRAEDHGVPPGLFQVNVIRLFAEQYSAVPRTRHSLPPRLNWAESTLRSSGSVVTRTLSVETAPLALVTFSVNVKFNGAVLDGTTNVGLAVSALASVMPAGAVQASAAANFEPVPLSVTGRCRSHVQLIGSGVRPRELLSRRR